jgi:isopentenyl-diphosphate delta-isomerase
LGQLIALVNIDDVVIGYEEKQLVHSKGLLHRAFSIIIVNTKGELLLQRRAIEKYHSAGLWTNTCCSHLPKGFDLKPYAHQRLKEEMGFDCDLKYVETFHYKVDFQDGMIENEIDHIYLGVFNDNPQPDPNEVYDWKWIGIDEVKVDIVRNPDIYTYWFRFIVENHLGAIRKLLISST